MQVRPLRLVITILMALIVLAGVFSGGILVGFTLSTSNSILSSPIQVEVTPAPSVSADMTPTAVPDTETLFKPFWDTWDLVHQQYVDQPVDDATLMQGAIRGMLASLGDLHTSYMDPSDYKNQLGALNGQYDGIGAYTDITGSYIKIISPMPGSPAESAGIKAGDIIIKVDGVDMTGIDGAIVHSKVIGKAGTKVLLTVFRESTGETLDIEITRATIKVASVSSKMLDDKIAYVRIISFGDSTAGELHTALSTLMKSKPVGLILDLRNNGGGYLDSAVRVISEFVDGGQVALIEQMGNGTRNLYKTFSGGLATRVPIVVLVNEGTASASEITAGTLRDYERAKIVGTLTYGKGSVQIWQPLTNDEGAVRVTIARWLTPNGISINKVGVKPDVEAKLSEEDIKAGLDPQLDKAIEVMKSWK